VILWLEISRDGVDLLLWFGRQRREGRRCFVDGDWVGLWNFLIAIAFSRRDSQSEFRRNFRPKHTGTMISIERIPFSLINQWNKIPNSITHAFELSDIVCLFISLTFLFRIYLAMKSRVTLIFLVSCIKCSIKPWRKMEWNEPLQSCGSVGAFGSYRSWMLITSSSCQTWVGVASLFTLWSLVGAC